MRLYISRFFSRRNLVIIAVLEAVAVICLIVFAVHVKKLVENANDRVSAFEQNLAAQERREQKEVQKKQALEKEFQQTFGVRAVYTDQDRANCNDRNCEGRFYQIRNARVSKFLADLKKEFKAADRRVWKEYGNIECLSDAVLGSSNYIQAADYGQRYNHSAYLAAANGILWIDDYSPFTDDSHVMHLPVCESEESTLFPKPSRP